MSSPSQNHRSTENMSTSQTDASSEASSDAPSDILNFKMSSHQEQTHSGLLVWYMRGRSVILSVMAILGLVSMILFIISGIFGVKVMVVKSESMEPTIGVGSVVVSLPTEASRLKVGDVITVTYGQTKRLVTHRIVQSEGCEQGLCAFVLKGDANIAKDPHSVEIGAAPKFWFTIPTVGWAVLWMKTWTGLVAVAVTLLTTLIITFIVPKQTNNLRDTSQ